MNAQLDWGLEEQLGYHPLSPPGQAALEQAAKERAEMERAAKEQAAKDQATQERAAREQAAREKAAREGGVVLCGGIPVSKARGGRC